MNPNTFQLNLVSLPALCFGSATITTVNTYDFCSKIIQLGRYQTMYLIHTYIYMYFTNKRESLQPLLSSTRFPRSTFTCYWCLVVSLYHCHCFQKFCCKRKLFSTMNTIAEFMSTLYCSWNVWVFDNLFLWKKKKNIIETNKTIACFTIGIFFFISRFLELQNI